MTTKDEIKAWAIGGGILAAIGLYKAHSSYSQIQPALQQGGTEGLTQAATGASGAVTWGVVAALGGATAVYALGLKKTPVDAIGHLLK